MHASTSSEGSAPVLCEWDPESGRMRIFYDHAYLALTPVEADQLVAALLAAMATQTDDVFLSLHGQGGPD